jgi:hypothetical protein
VLHVCALMLHTRKCLHIHGRRKVLARLQIHTTVLHVCALMLHPREHTRGKAAMMLHDLSSQKKKTGEASGNDAAEPQLSGGSDPQDRRFALPAVFAGFSLSPPSPPLSLFVHELNLLEEDTCLKDSLSGGGYMSKGLFVHVGNLLGFICLRDRGGEG